MRLEPASSKLENTQNFGFEAVRCLRGAAQPRKAAAEEDTQRRSVQSKYNGCGRVPGRLILVWLQEEELKDIIEKAREMEDKYGHFFDMIIINNDTERAYHQLLAEINSLEREPQWVPAAWVKAL